MSPDPAISVRPIREGDEEVIATIYRSITGEKSAGFWRGVLQTYLAPEEEQRQGLSPEFCQVAEVNGDVVGFMVGDIQSWQFGIPRSGRIVTVGVHPEHRRRQVGQALIGAMFETFAKYRVPQIQCLIAPGDPLGDFFQASGFEMTGWQVLQRTVSP